MKYQNILFDADDTLLDYTKAELKALQKVFRRHGMDCSPETQNIFADLCDSLWLEYGLENTRDPYVSSHYHEMFLDYSVRRFEIFTSLFPAPVSAGQMNAEYTEELSKCHDLTEGAYEICRILASSCELCVITNGLWHMQKRRFEHSRIKEYITTLVVSETAKYAKPNPLFFEFALKKSEITDKSSTLVVGDSLVNDIFGASSFGMDTCWINKQKKQNLSDILPTYEIGNLMELEAVVS